MTKKNNDIMNDFVNDIIKTWDQATKSLLSILMKAKLENQACELIAFHKHAEKDLRTVTLEEKIISEFPRVQPSINALFIKTLSDILKIESDCDICPEKDTCDHKSDCEEKPFSLIKNNNKNEMVNEDQLKQAFFDVFKSKDKLSEDSLKSLDQGFFKDLIDVLIDHCMEDKPNQIVKNQILKEAYDDIDMVDISMKEVYIYIEYFKIVQDALDKLSDYVEGE